MLLKILPVNDSIQSLYENHTHFHPGDSGLDIFIPEDTLVPANTLSFKISTGISCEALQDSNNCSYYLYLRSSTAANTPLRLANSVGIIDSAYRGEIIAIIDNHSSEDYQITSGTRLLQICAPNLESIQVEIVNSLSETSRGTGGLGSTGA